MRVSDMVPFNITSANLANFLSGFGAELGIPLTAANYATTYLCPNPNFDTNNPSTTVKSMILAGTGNVCPSVTHTDTECFAIKNVTETTDKGTEITQRGTIIANSGSEFFTVVNAFDVASLSNAKTAINFSRNWNCAGDFITLNFANFSPTRLAQVEAELRGCFELEEQLNNGNGMGEYSCGKDEEQNSVNNFAENGGGGASFGKFGGDYAKQVASTNCSSAGINAPDRLFVNGIDTAADTYCVPLGGDAFKNESATVFGSCANFTVAAKALSEAKIEMGGLDISEFAYTQDGVASATAVVITWNNGITTCNDTYDITQPSFGGQSFACF